VPIAAKSLRPFYAAQPPFIFDPARRWTLDASKSLPKSRNTPFDGWQLTGKAVATIVGSRFACRAD
jgi:dihydroorotase